MSDKKRDPHPFSVSEITEASDDKKDPHPFPFPPGVGVIAECIAEGVKLRDETKEGCDISGEKLYTQDELDETIKGRVRQCLDTAHDASIMYDAQIRELKETLTHHKATISRQYDLLQDRAEDAQERMCCGACEKSWWWRLMEWMGW